MAVGNASTTTPLKERASIYVYLASLYFVIVGLLYLWGYWSPFGIDIMQYVGLSDVAKLAVYPVASSFAAGAIGVLASWIRPLLPAHMFPPGGGRYTPTGRVLNRLLPLFGTMYTLGIVALLVLGPVTKWLVVPWLIALPVTVLEQRRGVFRSLWPNESARTTVMLLLTALPVWAYGQGRLKAAAVLDGKEYYYLAANTIDNLPVGDLSASKDRVKYLGQVNEYVFLLLPDNTTWLVIRFDKTHGLQIRHFRASRS